MEQVCRLLESVDRLTTGPELFYAFIAFAMANTAVAVTYRAKKNNGDFSFMWKSYFTFELLNWNKYGIFAVIHIILFSGLILTILLLPIVNRHCMV